MTWSAADELGLTAKAREAYRRRLAMLFAEGCAIYGPRLAAKLFRDQARAAPKETARRRPAPPTKKRGGHDVFGDRLLVASWNSFGSKNKTAWAKMALKNHAVKSKGKVSGRTILPRSLVRKLDRLLKAKTLSETNRKR